MDRDQFISNIFQNQEVIQTGAVRGFVKRWKLESLYGQIGDMIKHYPQNRLVESISNVVCDSLMMEGFRKLDAEYIANCYMDHFEITR